MTRDRESGLVIFRPVMSCVFQTREIFELNFKEKCQNEVLIAIKGKIDEIKLPKGLEYVDVIISEWMG